MKVKILYTLLILNVFKVFAQKDSVVFADKWRLVGRAVEEKGYYIWGTSPIWGEDGKVHLFVAR